MLDGRRSIHDAVAADGVYLEALLQSAKQLQSLHRMLIHTDYAGATDPMSVRAAFEVTLQGVLTLAEKVASDTEELFARHDEGGDFSGMSGRVPVRLL